MPTATATPAADQQAIVQQSIRKVTTLATLPEITTRIVSTVENPKSTAADLHKIIAHDPALITRVLKVVNSAFYGLPGQVNSIERAIVLLGLNAVKNISVAASLGQLFRGVKLCKGLGAKDLWMHCVAVGITARELARQMQSPFADEAFLCGMIHDIGILVSLQVNPEQLRVVCETATTSSQDFCSIERDILGVDHQQLGAGLAAHWKFPKTCQQAAGYHHRPTDLAEDARLLVTLVYVADTLCCQKLQGFTMTAIHQQLESAQPAAIGLTPDMINTVAQNLEELVKQSASLFA